MATDKLVDFIQTPFDFLIVGGGTAGLVLAARLSEEPGIQVGVIEAGSLRLGDPKVDLPTGSGQMISNPDYDWNFESIPQAGTNGKSYHIPRGKMLGGSSGINFMSYNRPSAEDIDDWASKLGVTGWTWSELLPYFKRSEGLEPVKPNTSCPVEPKVHGTDGPIHTSIGPWQPPIEESILAAFDETSRLQRPVEPYDGTHLGFYRSLFTLDRTSKPVRSYAASGYLAPIMGRHNLKILENAQVCRILLSDAPDGTPTAEGIELQHMEARFTVSAKKEVILSAGSIQSPQLLELSGIGDPSVLKSAGIACRVAITDVGNNLQEHTMSAVSYELADGIISVDSLLKDPALLQEHQRLYAENHSGALSGSVSLMGFTQYSLHSTETQVNDTVARIFDAPSIGSERFQQNANYQRKQQEAIAGRMRNSHSADIQFIGTPAYFNTTAGYRNCAKIASGSPAGYNACYSIVVSNMYPLSRGSVHAWTSNPIDAPEIDPGFLRHPVDVDVLSAGIVFADRVFQSTSLIGKIGRRVSPPADLNLSNMDETRQFIRNHIVSYHHALGTCAMGQVVDEKLRVKGVRSLRVVDASVMPMQVSAAIMATVYAIAEKASDIIKEDYGFSTRASARL
ncbi:Glucose-methanol-choline oxidoreductase, C-terminal [Penicillium expansum]|uniref:Glucose-methanol-choline oxidoreductase, C-terminal n=1 Tax=Penicillium expansum TaxID=27334 RepID=A0A0A2K1M5_PENEN|nr:Glucose-methanol-choline oxidoreductase, C-terminal [Penicillium expansum]KGO36760.1 Glucose-methanol-choline oxidoreductase, C-terminal [Penicillium expansum]KGO60788.1 Glucose-methanol-choline oxidoreductase, C-terminal [Penicillium expansum]KGO67387.1 Glucose-methanol-choline oxidoreductase, C-terminal [Penicillium expansum]UPX44764.1 Dehydrogenase mpl7 [Penicillium camemberti]